MAQRVNKSKSKGTSFGKKSSAEKAFRSKKKSRPDDSFGGERKSSSGPASFSRPFRKSGEEGSRPGGFSKSRPDSGPGDFKKPFQKREGGSFGKPGGFRKTGGDFKRPFQKREGDSFNSDKPRFSKPFRSEGGD